MSQIMTLSQLETCLRRMPNGTLAQHCGVTVERSGYFYYLTQPHDEFRVAHTADRMAVILHARQPDTSDPPITLLTEREAEAYFGLTFSLLSPFRVPGHLPVVEDDIFLGIIPTARAVAPLFRVRDGVAVVIHGNCRPLDGSKVSADLAATYDPTDDRDQT